MSKALDNGGWAPEPMPRHTAEAHRLIDEGYVQLSRRYRHLARMQDPLDTDYHPKTDPSTHIAVSIDTFSEFKRLGGSRHGLLAELRLEHHMLGYHLKDGNRLMRRWLSREFAKEGF